MLGEDCKRWGNRQNQALLPDVLRAAPTSDDEDTPGVGGEGPASGVGDPHPVPSPSPGARGGHAPFLPTPLGIQVSQPLKLPHPTKVHRAPKFGAFCPVGFLLYL